MPDQEIEHDDIRLLAASAAGDREAFRLVVARHQAAVLRYARTLTGEAAAEDALQETFLAAWRHAAGFRGEGSVKGWLFTITRRAVLRARRRHVGEPEDLTPLSELGEAAGFASPERQPEDRLLERERTDRVRLALERLSVGDREALTLFDLDGLSGPEAAEVLGLPLPTFKTRLHRARLRFAAELRRERAEGRL